MKTVILKEVNYEVFCGYYAVPSNRAPIFLTGMQVKKEEI